MISFRPFNIIESSPGDSTGLLPNARGQAVKGGCESVYQMVPWQKSHHNIDVNISQHATITEAQRPRGDKIVSAEKTAPLFVKQ